VPALALNGQRRLGPALAIALGCVAALGAAASIVFGHIGDDWLRVSLVVQVIVVAGLAAVLARQITALRRTQGSLVAANNDLAGAQASLETNNRMLRATQADLKRARQQLIDGFEGLSDGFALYDGEDRLVVCNSRYRELFGLHPDLLRPGTPFVDILRAHVGAGRVAAAVGREEEWIAERLAQHRDPHGLFERNIDGHWFRFSDRPTSEGGTVTIFTGIDDLKQREQRLRDNQAILQSVLDHIPVTISITDRERRIVLLNRRLEDIYGVHLAEAVGRNVDEVRPARYRGDSAARDHLRVLETGEPILGRQDGYGQGRDAESWITNVAPIKDPDGAVRYVLRATFEVPQLAQANRELADYRAFLVETERQAKIASWHQSADGDYRTVWSENLEAVIGYTAAEIHDDATFLAVVHPDDRDRIASLFRQIDRDAQSYDAEYRIVRADGRIVWIRDITKAELDGAGDVVRFIGSIQDITESKRAEQALRDSETLLKEAQRRARLAYWLWDPKARRYTLAAEAAEILGLPVEGLATNDHFLPHIHEDDRAWVAEAYLGQTERLEPCILEYRWRRPDGNVIWLRDMCEQERDSDGQVRRLVGTIQDVTEQKRSEEALRENQALLLAAQRRARIAYWLEDGGSGQPFITSDLMAEVLDVPAHAVPATDGDYVKLVHPEDRARVAHAYERAVAGSTPYAIEYRIFRADGSIGWLRELAEFQAAPAGKPGRLIGTIQDITEQKTIEVALRDSEARLRAFMDHAPLAMFVKDLGGRFTMLNRHDAEFFGFPAEAIIGRRSADFLARDDAALVEAHDESVLTGGVPVERELHFVNRPRIEWSYEVKFPIRDAGGAVVALGGVAVDISTLKRTEQALRDSEARLRGFLDHAPFAMYLKDTDLRYLLVNRAVEQFQGMTAAEICGRTPDQIYPPALAARFVAEDREVLARGTPVTFEYSDSMMSSYADSLTVRFPVRDSDGRIVAIGGITQDISERKQTERALRASEARMRSFMDNAPVAVAIKDLDRRFVLLNSKIELAFGRPAAEMIGRRTIDLSDSEGAAAVDALEREVVATGQAVMAEAYFPERISMPWTFEVKFPIRDAQGEMVAIGGVAVDISDRKKAELALAESEARFRSFMDNAPFDMVVKDLTGRYQLVNRGAQAAWKRDEAAILGHRLSELSRSDGVAQVEAIEREVVESGRIAAGEVRFTDLGPEWTYEVKFPIRDAAGKIVALGGVALDISDRKRAQIALAESEARLRRAQQQARLAYWSWQFATDRTPEEYRWSPGSGELLGMADAAMPHNDNEAAYVTHEDDRLRVRRLYNEVRAGLDAYTVEYRVRRPDGRVVWVREIAEVVRDAEGRRVGVEGTMQDITDQRALEEQLRQAQKMESIGQLTGGIAHDFNNLMAVILGNLELLAEDLPGNAAALQKIDTAIRSTLRGSDLTQRLLAFARQQSLAPKLTQIDDLIRSMRDLLLRPLGPAIEVRFDLAGGLQPAEIDQARLETSLLNLVINARDAMPEGGRLTIATANVAIGPDDIRQSEGLTPGDYILISVSDDGAGMTAEVRARAFDPFFTTKGIGKGTGLGLSMVYGFVKQSGGHVELASEVGRGTTVMIYLPVAKSAAAGRPQA